MKHVMDIVGVDLGYMARVRRTVAHLKSQEVNLITREAASHEFSVLEYSNHLLNHLINLERNDGQHVISRPNIVTFESQPQINAKMRLLIFDFLMCCHTRLGLSSSTLFLCFNILDRYTSKYIVKSCNYQLLALTALWISSKFWDSKNRITSLKHLTKLCCKQYSAQQFKEMELHLLKSLNWSLCQFATHDSFIDLLLFMKDNKTVSPQILHENNLNVDLIKFGSMMLCELACFDIKLSFNCSASQIVLAAITLTTLAIKFDDLNQWEDLDLVGNDANLIRVCHSLLALVLKTDSLPSSFKFKYINEGKTTSEKILKALQNYFIQLQMEQFYRSQEFETLQQNTLTSYEKRNDFNDNEKNKDDVSTTGVQTMGQSFDHSFASNTSNIASSHSATTPPAMASSSASPFASPFMAHDLFTNSPDSSTTPAGDRSLLSFSRSTTTSSGLLPLTPTTPTLLQNKMAAIKRRSMAGRNLMAPSRTNTEGTEKFVKGHRKRASSSMDIDFFENDIALKR